MSPLLSTVALLLPLLGGYALGAHGGWRGAAMATVSLILGAAAQRAAKLYASPWDEFQGIERDD